MSPRISYSASHEGTQALRAIRETFHILADELKRAAAEDMRCQKLRTLILLVGKLTNSMHDMEHEYSVYELKALKKHIDSCLELWGNG